MRTLFRLISLAALAACICAAGNAFAQDATTNSAAAGSSAPAAPKPRAKGIVGFVDKVDNDAKTLTLKDHDKPFTITSKTRITRDNEPATLADLMPGDRVTVHAKDDPSGNPVATSIRARKPKGSGGSGASTNAPADSK